MPLLANAGLPMIALQLPLMVCALVPIIVLEALLLRRWLALPYRRTFLGVGVANVVSTLLGVPAAWLVMLLLQIATGFDEGFHSSESDSPVLEVLRFLASAAWLGPPDEIMILLAPAASAVLLVPCFFLSIWIERSLCVRFWPGVDLALLHRKVYLANVVSYAVLFALAWVWLAFELVRPT